MEAIIQTNRQKAHKATSDDGGLRRSATEAQTGIESAQIDHSQHTHDFSQCTNAAESLQDMVELERARTDLQSAQSALNVQAGELQQCREEIAAMSSSKAKYNDLFYSAPIGYLLVDELQQILSVNSKAAELLGVSSSSVTHTLLPLYIVPEYRKELGMKIKDACRGASGSVNVKLLTNGEVVAANLDIQPVKNHDRTGFVCQISIMVISENHESELQLKNARDYLQHIATHDALTDLPNRRQFYGALDDALNAGRRTGTSVAVLMLDLDRFKFVNDSLGHDAGDELLVEAAKRLNDCVLAGDTVARLGGDEFSIVLRNIENQTTVDNICESIRVALAEPFQLNQHEVSISTSIGVCMYPLDSIQGKELLKYSDAALYKSKSMGGNRVQLFSKNLRHNLKRQIQTESDLRGSVSCEEFDTWYQTIHSLSSGKVHGIEALARWRHPKRGLLLASDFIGMAEECGYIGQIGNLILSQSCKKLAQLHTEGHSDLWLSVNISPKQISQPGLVKEIEGVLKKADLDPKYLELEVTEGTLFEHPERSMHCLKNLRAMGVTLAVDDFGTGYSSFSRLRRLPITKIKIDQSFVAGLPSEHDACSIVKAIISIAEDLGLEVVAEGVEAIEQLDYLHSVGCDLTQGFLLAAPVSAESIAKTITQHS